jgi:hypothetical protein
MHISKHFFCFFLLCAVVGQSKAQEWTSYKSTQGVSDYLDMGDELYLATDAGLVIVDKNTLEHSIYGIEGSNLSTDHFRSVARSSSGETFIGTYDVVVARFDGSGFQDIIVPDGLNPLMDPELYDLEVSETGELWLATSQGIFRQLGDEWIKYNHVQLGWDFFKVWDIEFGPEGAVYAGTGNGVYKFENDTWTHLSEGTQVVGYLDADVFFSKAGDLFFAGALDFVGKFDGDSWTMFSTGDLNGAQINGFTEDLDGNIYVDTWFNGVFKLTGDSLAPIDEELNVGGNLPRTSFYYVDEQGVSWYNRNIYLSTNKNGNIESTTLSSTSIEYNLIYDVKKGANGEMFFLMHSSTNSISVLHPDGEWSLLTIPVELNWTTYSGNLLYLGENDIWLSSHYGLYHYDGAEWTFITDEPCDNILQNSQGRIYVQSPSKVLIIENGNISEYNQQNAPLNPLHYVSAIGLDAEDNLWLASNDGNSGADVNHTIQKVSSAGEWTTYKRDDHEAIKFPRGEFHFDVHGNVWVPSSFGVIKFDGQNFTNPMLENSAILEAYQSHSIESDADGKIYIGTNDGIATLYEGEWEEMIIDATLPITAPYSVALKFDDSGLLWCGYTVYGLHSFLPAGVTSTMDVAESQSSDFSIYPNPAIGNTTVAFTLESGAEVDLSVFNKLGQQLGYKALGYLKEGSHEVDLELSNFPSGMYIVQLRLGEYRSIKKLIID